MKKVQKALEKPIFAIEKVAREEDRARPGEVLADVVVKPEVGDDMDMKSVYSKWRVEKEELYLQKVEVLEHAG